MRGKSGQRYRRVTVRVMAVTPKSIRVRPIDDEEHKDIIIGRSTLSYICDDELDRLETPQEHQIEAMEWLLQKEGLI